MEIFERIVGWLWDSKSEQWKKPDEPVWQDVAGEKRSSVIVRGVGVGADGVGYEHDTMCGLPDPNVRYVRPRDPFDVMADEGGAPAAWYRGLYKSDFFD